MLYFIADHLFSAEDKKLENLRDANVMEDNGWKIHCNKKVVSAFSQREKDLCGSETWFGSQRNNAIGWVNATFVGSGTATLNFGNCWKEGNVWVYLNDKELSNVSNGTPTKEITFSYSESDILGIKEDNAIIKLNSLKLKRTGMQFMQQCNININNFISVELMFCYIYLDVLRTLSTVSISRD